VPEVHDRERGQSDLVVVTGVGVLVAAGLWLVLSWEDLAGMVVCAILLLLGRHADTVLPFALGAAAVGAVQVSRRRRDP
jgi:hypothetical protein